jgi:hypothetical protein
MDTFLIRMCSNLFPEFAFISDHLTNSIEQSLSWDANSRTADEEIRYIL